MWVDCHPVHLAQVVSNLVHNSAKLPGEGGQIRVTASAAAGLARISVRDDGVGIAPALLPHVFELFVQEEQAAERNPGGLGIGLTLVQRLVRMHGGRVEAFSAGRGYGSEFVVTLPCVAAGPVRPAIAIHAAED